MKKYTILIAAVAAMGGLLFGFDTAVIAGTLPSLKPYFALSNADIGLVVAAASIGCIPGALFAGQLADGYGRKKMLLLTAILFLVAAIGSGIAGSFWELVGYRFVGGLAIGMASTLAPIYISEVSPAAYRGRLGMLQQLAIVVGILLAFVSNYLISEASFSFLTDNNHWRFMLGAAVAPSILFFIMLLIIPESPRWLIAQDKKDQARSIFAKIYDAEHALKKVEEVIADLKTSIQKIKFSEIFGTRYRRVVIIGIVFASIAQLTGINIIFYYAPLIFEKTNMGGGVLFQTMLTGVANLIFTILAFWMIDRYGRKKLLIWGSSMMGLFMLIIGYLFYSDNIDSYWILVMIFLYIGAFACTWGAVLWVYVAEIFPNRIRGHATSFAVFGNWTMNTIVSYTFPLLLNGLGPATTFILYGVINMAMVFFVIKYIFETKGVSLEDVEKLYAQE